MQKFSILDCYIGKIICNYIAMTLFILISLSSIVKFVDQLKKAGQGSYDVISAGTYTILSLPKDIYIFSPIASLLGTLLGIGMLAQRSELVIMQSSGFTNINVVISVMKTTIPLLILSMAFNELVAPQSEQIARNYRSQAMYGGSLLSTQNGLWVKDDDSFVHIKHINGNNELSEISIYTFNQNRYLQSIYYITSAKFDTNKKIWCLSQVDEYIFQDTKQINMLKTFSAIWKTSLTPDKLDVVALDPDALSIRSLYHYVKYLKSSGQDASRYQFNMWSKIFQPISAAVMILMALSFIFGLLHSTTMEGRVIVGISFGLLFYILDQIFGLLTLVYGISPIICALLPNTILFLASLYFMLKNL